MEKRRLRRWWIGIVLIANAGLLLYLHVYQNAGGFYFGIPEALIVLVLLIMGTVTVNSIMGWLYLGKPDLTELFVLKTADQTTTAATTEDD